MEADLLVNHELVIPGAELSVTASRAGGPGGQHVNKTSTRVTVRWNVAESAVLGEAQRTRLLSRLAGRVTADGELQVSAGDERSQHRNRELARGRLAGLVRQALHVPRHRTPTHPGAAAQRRRVEEKRRRGALKRQRRAPAD